MTRQEPGRVERLFWKSAPAAEETRRFANELFEGAVAKAGSSDQLVARLSENWRLDRLATVDRNILRLAIYELRSGRTPTKVVIDEALKLAKKFSSAEAPSFLNGILDAASKHLESLPQVVD
jgi:transcription antitermination protein NusB